MFNNNPQKYINRNDIKEIKKKFDWIVIHSVNSKIPGVTLEQAMQIVAQQIDSSPHIFSRWVTRQSRRNVATWPQILELIETYNQQQETAFDNQIYEQSSFQFIEDKFMVMKPSYFQITNQQEKQIFVYYIENMSYVKLKQEFAILIFNNKTLALMNIHNFKPILVVSAQSIEKTKKKQADEFMGILQRLDQQQSKDSWKKQINFYKKSIENSFHFERLDTNSSMKERLDPILQCKRDIEHLQKVVNLNPWDPQLRPLNPDPKMQLIRKRGQSEHSKRYQVLEQENYKLNSSLQVQLICSKDNNIILVLENLVLQYYQLEYDYKNGDYSLKKCHEFTLNDKIDQIAITQNKWIKQDHCLILKSKQMLVYSMPDFKLVDKIQVGQQADTMLSNKIIIICQYDGLFSIIKENLRKNQQEQFYSVGLQKQVKFNDLKQSVSSLDYSSKYQFVIFGSMCTLVSIYDIRKGQFIHQFSVLNTSQQFNQMNDKILRVFVFDSQNQYLIIFTSGYVTIWDIQRHKKIQECMKQSPQNKTQQQYFQGMFLEQRGMLLLGGFNLQSWVSRINPIQISDTILDSNSSPIYS
ncbi:unnamed protein product (macronuclear) [Paramecium tetraurelia]|uniref:Uncharacterized protein n=1 Tax=Paramecium tetraurelia TaxID=5888 RepID=A0CMG8_PARTE|nr:uncharacterized protein GSPATT00008464001 [Paramecium tetraurelia]CAK71985.1 unnamed protein product [Paramecium tetraurelia]|eukprot:XP_001439382.1 hypothetical protein (macronuclear) [Paramecium tetraurelia strain d4-2]